MKMHAVFACVWLMVGWVLAVKHNTLNQENEPMITLQSADGKILEMSNKTAQLSGLLRGVLEFASEAESEMIPLPTIDYDVLVKIDEFSTKYVQDPPSLPAMEGLGAELIQFNQDQQQYNSAFFNKVSMEMLFRLIIAADYMDHAILLRAATQQVAKMMEGRSTEEMRIMFNIINDFTPQEEQQLAKESEWARGLPVSVNA